MCDIAAEKGNLELLKIAHTVLGIPFGTETYWNAVENGHLHVLKWLHANGCKWDVQSCPCAALNGHVEVLTWLRALGCPRSHGPRRGKWTYGNFTMGRGQWCPLVRKYWRRSGTRRLLEHFAVASCPGLSLGW
jgi:hypothetical protein